MYCIHCGVKLGGAEKKCPLCGVVVFHPEIIREEGEPLYPGQRYPAPQVNSRAAQIVVTTFVLMTALITLGIDWQVDGAVRWAGYVTGALFVGYVMFVLPFWFQKRNPVVFTPITFGAIGLYLWYINYAVDGDWFLRFAFPVTGYVAAVITAFVVLMRYLRRGRLYIVGGLFLAFGVFMPLLEFLIWLTFSPQQFGVWFMYPMIVLVLLGAMFIFLAVCRPARETMERKFFV